MPHIVQVLFNLANQYLANKMFTEALNTYLLIVKNKLFNNGGMPAGELFTPVNGNHSHVSADPFRQTKDKHGEHLCETEEVPSGSQDV